MSNQNEQSMTTRPRAKRLSPAGELLDRLFEWPINPGPVDETAPAWTPAVDVIETDDAYKLRALLPDVRKEDVDLQVEDDSLILSGETNPCDETRFVRKEVPFGRFYRRFRMTHEADPSKIRAGFADGILTVHIPKKEEAKPRKVTIES